MAQTLKTDSLYDRDVDAWTQDQAAQLRSRATFDDRDDIDWTNAAGEIESLGRSQRNEIGNRLLVVLVPLLKGRYRPERRSRSWKARRTASAHRRRDVGPSEPCRLSGQRLRARARHGALDGRGRDRASGREVPDRPFTVKEVPGPSFYAEAAS